MKLLFLSLAAFVLQVHGQCDPSPCGDNTECIVKNEGTALCKCLEGWNHRVGGNTIEGCPNRREATPQRQPPRVSSRPSRPRPSVNLPNRLGPTAVVIESAPSDPCRPSPCGTNAQCNVVGNRAVCTCQARHFGDPYTNCEVNPCDTNPCGVNAECENTGARAICKCPRGFTGDPFVRCNDNPCAVDPCGANAECEAQGSRAICKCRANYDGDPFVQCNANPCLNNPCGSNADCERNGARAVCRCLDGYEGDPFVSCNLNPCFKSPCGANAECDARGRSAVCRCLQGYVGDPFVSCNLEPCSTDPCGSNAECESRGRSAICKCPRGFTGDPYTNCVRDPCSIDPCGANARCRNARNAAVCECPEGHVGDPYVSCQFDPCADAPCGPNTDCSVSGQRSICRCIRGYTGSPNSRSGCQADPCSVNDICGPNADCTNESGRPVCRCRSRHVGQPYSDRGCVQGECVANSDCAEDQACKDFQCVDPCSFSCGRGADCRVQNHVAICLCPRGFTGDPFQSCRKFTKDEICAKCGANTDCNLGRDDRPICRCRRDYIGNPLQGCRRECESNGDCSVAQECVEFKCQAACRSGACGDNANCLARNNRPQCSCPPDFLGDARTRCYTECTRHDECSQDLACVKFKCKDPCREPDPNVCGTAANCEVKNHKPICSCPRGYTGDPFVSCREFTRQDLCSPNPCGAGARCQPGTDRSGGDRPVCTCPTGFRGDPLVSCSRGECDNDSDCSESQACYNFQCKDSCADACGVNAQCRARSHGAICSCLSGYVGDPLTACRLTRNRTSGPRRNQNVIGLSNRFRRSILRRYHAGLF